MMNATKMADSSPCRFWVTQIWCGTDVRVKLVTLCHPWQVEYQCDGFLEKNRDTVYEEQINILKASKVSNGYFW